MAGNPIATLSSGKVVSINNLVPYPQTPSEWSSDYIDNPNREYFGYTGYTKLLVFTIIHLDRIFRFVE